MPIPEDTNARGRERHAWRMANDPEYRERRRQYAAAQNARVAERRKADAEYDEKYRERERNRHYWRRKNPEYVDDKRQRGREYARKRLEEQPEAVRLQKRVAQANRRAKKRSQFIESIDPRVVYEMHGGMCGICKQFIENDFHVDHVIPLSKGGLHGYMNVQPAHPLCNIRKGNRAG